MAIAMTESVPEPHSGETAALTFTAVVDCDDPHRPILAVTGTLNHITVPLFEGGVRDVVAAYPGATIRLDLRRVSSVDSAGMTSVLNLAERALATGGGVQLTAWSRCIERNFAQPESLRDEVLADHA